MFTFHQAHTEAEVREITALRYQIYVQEMEVYVDQANHEAGVFTDALDATNRLLYVRDGAEMVGAMSLVMGCDAPFPESLRAIYDLLRYVQVLPESKMAAAIRLVVKPEYRSTSLPFKLMAEGARQWVEAGVELAFCTCQPHLLNLYHRLGFQSYAHEVFNDPEFGIMVPLVMVTGDDAHFRQVQSPLGELFAKGKYNAALLPDIYKAMGHESVAMIEHPSAAEWSELAEHLETHSNERISFFEGLAEEEIKQVIALGNVIQCLPGDRVIKAGQVTQTVFVPLEGNLEVRVHQRTIAKIGQGEMLGEMVFLVGGRRTADVVAGPEGAKVLSLNQRNLQHFIEQPSPAANRLLLNISRSLALRLQRTNQTLFS